MKVEHKIYGHKGKVEFKEEYPKVTWKNNIMRSFTLRVDFSLIMIIVDATNEELDKLRPFQKKMVEEYEKIKNKSPGDKQKIIENEKEKERNKLYKNTRARFPDLHEKKKIGR